MPPKKMISRHNKDDDNNNNDPPVPIPTSNININKNFPVNTMETQMNAMFKQLLGDQFDTKSFINEVKDDILGVLQEDPKGILEPMKTGNIMGILQNPRLQGLVEKMETKFEKNIDRSRIESLIVLNEPENQKEKKGKGEEKEIEPEDINIEKTMENIMTKLSSLNNSNGGSGSGGTETKERISKISNLIKEMTNNDGGGGEGGIENMDMDKVQELVNQILPSNSNSNSSLNNGFSNITKALEAIQMASKVQRKGKEAKEKEVHSDEVRKRLELKKILDGQLDDFSKKRLPKPIKNQKKKSGSGGGKK